MDVSFYIGWVFLVLSWIVPAFIQNKDKKHFIGGVLAALATGIFLCGIIDKFTK